MQIDTTETIEKIMDLLKIDLASTEMQILGAVLRCNANNYDPTTLKAILKRLQGTGQKPITQNWLYKCLMKLEDEQFVKIDRIRKPYLFHSSIKQLEIGIEQARVRRVEEIRKEVTRLEKDIATVHSIDVEEIIERFRTMFSEPKEDKKIFEGQNIVQSAIVNEIFLKAKEEDLIYGVLPISLFFRYNERTFELVKIFLKAISRGAKARILLMLERKVEQVEGLAKSLSPLTDILLKALQSGRLALRVYSMFRKTYRFYALNEQRMLLFLTDLLYPDLAFLFTAPKEKGIIADALKTFEELWKESKDIGNRLENLLQHRL